MKSLLGGIAALLGGIWDHAHFTPIVRACHSMLGVLGQALDRNAFQGCQFADLAIQVQWLLIIGGIVAIAGSVISFLVDVGVFAFAATQKRQGKGGGTGA